jgi:hypothetical protein
MATAATVVAVAVATTATADDGVDDGDGGTESDSEATTDLVEETDRRDCAALVVRLDHRHLSLQLLEGGALVCLGGRDDNLLIGWRRGVHIVVWNNQRLLPTSRRFSAVSVSRMLLW